MLPSRITSYRSFGGNCEAPSKIQILPRFLSRLKSQVSSRHFYESVFSEKRKIPLEAPDGTRLPFRQRQFQWFSQRTTTVSSLQILRNFRQSGFAGACSVPFQKAPVAFPSATTCRNIDVSTQACNIHRHAGITSISTPPTVRRSLSDRVRISRRASSLNSANRRSASVSRSNVDAVFLNSQQT